MTLRIRTYPTFPVVLRGEGGFTVEKTNREYVVRPEFGALGLIESASVADHQQVWVYDENTGVYSRVSLNSLVTALSPSVAGITRAEAVLSSFADAITSIVTNGYHTAGDGGHALYVYSASAPSHPGYFESTDGKFWVFAGTVINVRQMGAKGDAVEDATTGAWTGTDDTAAFQNTELVGAALKIPRHIPGGAFISKDIWADQKAQYDTVWFGEGPSSKVVYQPWHYLNYTAQASNFTVGETVTGGTSGATAVIVADADAGTTGTLKLSGGNGILFQNGEAISTAGGSATVTGGGSYNRPLLDLRGTADGQAPANPTVYLTSAAAARDRTLVVNSTAALAVDQFVVLRDASATLSYGFGSDATPASGIGQVARIKSIDSAIGVTLYEQLSFDLQTNGTAALSTIVRRFTIPAGNYRSYQNVTVRDFDIVTDPSVLVVDTTALFAIVRMINVTVQNITVHRASCRLVNLFDVIGFLVNNIQLLRSPQNANYYGMAVDGCTTDGQVSDCYQQGGRHFFTTSTTVNQIEPSYITFTNCMAVGTHLAAFDIHAAAGRHINFINCQAHGANEDSTNSWVGTGFNLRGRYCRVVGFSGSGLDNGGSASFGQWNTIENSTFHACRISIDLTNCYSTTVRDCEIINSVENAIYIDAAAGATPYPKLRFENIDIYGNPSGAAVNNQSGVEGTDWVFENVRIHDATTHYSGISDELAYRISTKTANFTPIKGLGGTYLMDATAGNVSALPGAVAGEKGNRYTFRKTAGSNNAVINPDGTETIEGSLTYTLRDGEKVTIQSDGTEWKIIAGEVTATTTTPGVSELATIAETSAGTDTARSVTPDGLAGSRFGQEVISILVFDDSQNCVVGDGAADLFWRVPAKLNGMNLVGVAAQVQTAGTTGTMDMQIARIRAGTPADMLSTKLTIDTTPDIDTKDAATPAVIDATNDDVATGDQIRIDVDAVHTTPAKGLVVELTFQMP
jgi:hypothetical protein